MSVVEAHIAERINLSGIKVRVGGSALTEEWTAVLESVEVDSTFNRPDLCLVVFRAHDVDMPASFVPGSEITVDFFVGGEAPADHSFSGEITAVELEYQFPSSTRLTLRAYDRRHRLYRDHKTRSFKTMTFGDAIKKMAKEAGLTAPTVAGAAGAVHPVLYQRDVSSGDFVEQLAGELGWVVIAKGDTFWAGPPAELEASAGALEFGLDLQGFACRQTTDSWTDRVTVLDWDPKTKAALSAEKATADGEDASSRPPGPKGAKFATSTTTRQRLMPSQAHGRSIAAGLAAAMIDGAVQADGTATGNPKLRVGAIVDITKVGKAYAGRYRISAVRHVLASGGFTTSFSCRGAEEHSVIDALQRASAAASPTGPALSTPVQGVVPALVADNKDPEGHGRVKVTFPWLPTPDTLESDWMRLAFPDGGKNRGWLHLPEIGDEVLVAFEHGDFRRGYVLGGLWNGKDAPPGDASQLVGGDGKVKRRLFRSAQGHQLSFDEGPDANGIEVVTGDGKLKLRFDQKRTDILLDSGQTITVTAAGDIKITGKATITVEATSRLELKGADITVEARNGLSLKGMTLDATGTTSAKLTGAQTEVAGSAALDLKGGARATLQAGIVQIN